jgi:hypothetical protein
VECVVLVNTRPPCARYRVRVPVVVVYLGTHRPKWLEMDGPPLMVSRTTMPTRTLPRAVVPWFLDSGGFTEVTARGGWDAISAPNYARLVARYANEVGLMRWAAPQDWMVEPAALRATGRTIADHQRLTVDNFVELRSLAPELPVVPVLQGWTVDDYERCADLYDTRGVDLTREPLVGVGSVCRRQATTEARDIFATLAPRGLVLHGFGLKQAALRTTWPYLASTDSLAWSLNARLDARRGVVSCDPTKRKACGNCRHYALTWWATTCAQVRPVQESLPW